MSAADRARAASATRASVERDTERLVEPISCAFCGRRGDRPHNAACTSPTRAKGEQA